MKKTALITTMMIALMSLGAVYFINQGSEEITNQSQSQRDTQIDTSSSRDLFDYALSSLGEQQLDQIKARIQSLPKDQQGLVVDEALFETYLQYKTELETLESITSQQITLTDLEQLHQQIMALQSQYFTDEQIQTLFGEENRLRQLAIDKLAIANQNLDAESQAQWLEETLAEQPDYIQQAERNNQLIIGLNHSEQMEAQDKHLTRVELVGEEAAGRLSKLDEKREQFNSQLDSYLAQRNEILADNTLSDAAKQTQIAYLREQSFDTVQWRRVEALERIHDQNLSP
ncbi:MULTISPECIES: lipase secretion chaperone [Vibrio]|uniref:lipase secretion chaperone n=1 Tax=Vibrio TaxID=662 RepID=UPI0020752964|nr:MULTISPECIES: lipase secretion chaperone [Vibrio]USD33499.1 lipase secretion chaperone [Vibrio sp. SCSIO 43186]USD46568.1 lipase secretion chaperone [Vibrio sp. SCSIO 43145]USD70623.1 lipase secretion chaperone [Vibrio sp. SCSIO 43139]USD95543.1 lipase chaperone [Vibrio coralliilyticus]